MFFGLRVTAPLAYRLSHSAGHAVKEPLALHSLKFGAGNRFCLVLLAHKIQHARNGNKPAVLAGQPPQQIFNSWMHNSVIHETAGEMCVSDADPVLFFQPVLVCFAEQVAKRGTVMSVRAAEPHFHKRLSRIMVWHARIDALQINLAKNKVAHIVNPLAAEVAPKVTGVFDVTLKVTAMERRHRAIKRCNGGKASRPPIQIFLVAGMVRVHTRIMTDKALKLIKPSLSLAPV